jgi:hypothetical protein
MIDTSNSLNVMRALQGPQNQQQQQGGQDKAGGGLPPQVQQIVDALAKAIGSMIANAAKGGGDQQGQMSEGDRQQTRNAVNGVQGGRLSQERQQMTG